MELFRGYNISSIRRLRDPGALLNSLNAQDTTKRRDCHIADILPTSTVSDNAADLHKNTAMDPVATNVMDLLEQLDDEVDDLEEALAPILKAGLADTASKLPLLDKAKLYVLITYAVESMLFCKYAE